MNNHHLKHPSLVSKPDTKNRLHETIITNLNLEPFNPSEHSVLIEKSKNGRFSNSNCAVALYSNSYSLKSMIASDQAPYGYLYNRDSELFSFSVYHRYDGKLFGCIIPLSARLDTMSVFSRKAMSELPIDGIYVRFLKLPEYSHLVSGASGFKPAKEEPWLPDAPEEDESLSHSKVSLSKIISQDGSTFIFSNLRRSYNRGNNFLKNKNISYNLVSLTQNSLPVAIDIVKSHFSMIEKKGKLVGSSHHDYLGLLNPDIISLKSVTAYLGFLNHLPVSVFICENISHDSMAGYAGITLRANEKNQDILETFVAANEDRERDPLMGASAIPTYAFARLFLNLYQKGCRYFYMGGSEHADIDLWKQRQMSAEKDPTYWAIQTK